MCGMIRDRIKLSVFIGSNCRGDVELLDIAWHDREDHGRLVCYFKLDNTLRSSSILLSEIV